MGDGGNIEGLSMFPQSSRLQQHICDMSPVFCCNACAAHVQHMSCCASMVCPASPCLGLPCPALPCPGLPCPALPCPAPPLLHYCQLCSYAMSALALQLHAVLHVAALFIAIVSNGFRHCLCACRQSLCRLARAVPSSKRHHRKITARRLLPNLCV